MAEPVSLEGPVEIVDGELAILIPLDAGGAVLAPFAKGIGEIDGRRGSDATWLATTRE